MNHIKITPMAIGFFGATALMLWIALFVIPSQNQENEIVDSSISSFEECVAAGNAVMESYPRQCRAGEKTFVENIGNELEKLEFIRVSSPRPNQTISSPFIVEGQARGFWFFEADFPIRLFDANGNEIAVAIATAESNWMTGEFVPFKATLVFDALPQKGVLVLEKDNPSDLPELDDSLRMPVILQNIATSDTTLPLGYGVLRGTVDIGPICPVVSPNKPCDVPPEVYTLRQVIVYNEGRIKEIARTHYREDGTFSFELPEGTYVLDIEHDGIDTSDKLPAALDIQTGKTTIFNFSIDTGIR